MDSDKGTDIASLAEKKVIDRLLMAAVGNGELFWIEAYLAEGGDPNQLASSRDWENEAIGEAMKVAGEQSALMLALPHGVHVVARLLSAGANPNFVSGTGFRESVLHVAADHGGEVAKALLDAGADPMKRDAIGKIPLQRAVECSIGGCAKQIESGEAMIAWGMPQKALDLALRSACSTRPKQRRWIAPLAAAGADIEALAKDFAQTLSSEEKAAFERFDLNAVVGGGTKSVAKRM
jgi:hypothetical protein